MLADYAEAEGLDLGESVAYADSASDLPMLECVGFPVAVNPEARLAAIARRRGWHVEHWDKAGGGARPALPFGPVDHGVSRWWARLEGMLDRDRRRAEPVATSPSGPSGATAEAGDEGPRLRAQPGPLRRRRGWSRSLGGSGRGAAVGPLRLTDVDPPELPGPRLAPGPAPARRHLRVGPGHPRRAQLPLLRGHRELPLRPRPRGGRGRGGRRRHRDDCRGYRVVIEPVLGCVARGIVPPLPGVRRGPRPGGCERVAFGHLAPGLQIGFCADTGGGWSAGGLVAHDAQLHPVPDALSDEDAVMVEPTACAVHAALAAGVDAGDTVAVLGAGTLGLCTVAALRQLAAPGALLVGAKYAHQRRSGRRARRRRGGRPRPAGPGRAARGRGHSTSVGTAHRRGRRRDRLRRAAPSR